MVKTLVCISFLWLVACFAGLGADTNKYEWGPVAGECQMSIRLKDGGTEIKTNQPIDLIVRIRNVSTNETLHFSLYHSQEISPTNSTLVILSPAGKDIFVWHSPFPADGSVNDYVRGVSVPPLGTCEYGFRVWGLSENITNGVYKIAAKRRVLHGLTATSNPLNLKVVPGEWKDPNYILIP